MYQSYGLPWANAASRDAMLLAVEHPSVMIVQALQCIQLYWFGIGRPQAGNLCLGTLLSTSETISLKLVLPLGTLFNKRIALAYRSCQILGFDESGYSDKSTEHELGRRCFWACWTSTCIVMEPEPFIESAWKEVAMLPLPRSLASVSSPREAPFNQMMDENWGSLPLHTPTEGYHPPTAEGLLIKIVGVWYGVFPLPSLN